MEVKVLILPQYSPTISSYSHLSLQSFVSSHLYSDFVLIASSAGRLGYCLHRTSIRRSPFVSIPSHCILSFNALISPPDSFAGARWFTIFLELFLILGVLYTLATDSVSMHRFQISIFGAVAIAFTVNAVDFNGNASFTAMSVGYLILSIVNILWVLYFTSEEDSLAYHILNSMGNGGLSPPSRRRRTRTQSSMHNMGGGNGYVGGYTPGGAVGPQDVAYDTKVGGYQSGGNVIHSQNSFVGSIEPANRSIGAGTGGPGSINNAPGTTTAGSIGGADNGPHSPLMAGVGAGGSQATNSALEPTSQPADAFNYKARALYACTQFFTFFPVMVLTFGC